MDIDDASASADVAVVTLQGGSDTPTAPGAGSAAGAAGADNAVSTQEVAETPY